MSYLSVLISVKMKTMDNGYQLYDTELQSSFYILKLKNPSSSKFVQI